MVERDSTYLVGNLQSIVISRQPNVRLLPAVGSTNQLQSYPTVAIDSPDQSVDLGSLNIIQLLDGILDVSLVRLQVYDKHQCVVLLNLLHCRLGVEWVLDRSELVHSRKVGDGFSGVFGFTGEFEGSRSVE